MIEALRTFWNLTRPLAAAPFIFGFVVGVLTTGFMNPGLVLVYTAALTFTLGGAGHIVNSYADRAIDRQSAVKKDIIMADQPFAAGRVNIPAMLGLAGLLNALGLIVLASISLRASLLGVGLVLVGLAYSLGPRFKARPVLDVAASSALTFGATVLGAWLVRPDAEPPLLVVVWVTLLVAATYFLTLLVDLPEDSKAGVQSSAVALGAVSAARVSAALYLLSLMTFSAVVWYAALPFPFLILFLPGLVFGVRGYLKLLHEPARAGRLMRKAVAAAGASIAAVFIVYSLLFYSLFR